MRLIGKRICVFLICGSDFRKDQLDKISCFCNCFFLPKMSKYYLNKILSKNLCKTFLNDVNILHPVEKTMVGEKEKKKKINK